MSIVTLTYQHAAYIVQCLESLLEQRTTFPVEILIGEDGSTDGTREICQRYAAAHPDRIRLFLRDRKDVIHINGRPTGRSNFIRTLAEVRGKYIALCEGDDHWTDPLKLQKQVDALEADPGLVACYHPVMILKDKELVADFITQHHVVERSDINDLASHGNFIHTPSVVYRNVLTGWPPSFMDSPVGDYFLYMLLAQHGDFKRLPDTMAVYRYGSGIFSTLHRVERMRSTIGMFEAIRKAMPPAVAQIFETRIGHLNVHLERLTRDHLVEKLQAEKKQLTPEIMDRAFTTSELMKALTFKLTRRFRGHHRP